MGGFCQVTGTAECVELWQRTSVEQLNIEGYLH